MPSAPKRILVVHNAYQQRGGEDTVVEAEVDLLRKHGHAVATYSRHNVELNTMSRAEAAITTFWSQASASHVAKLIDDFRPDVMHVHNTFPLISPSIYWIARGRRVPVVQTLHNFRLVCPQGMLLRDSKPCEDCVGHAPWPAIRHACYRGSRPQTAVLAGMLASHRAAGTWQRAVTTYIALTEFSREKLVAGGLPRDRIRVKPNFVDLPAGRKERREGFLYVGRLSHEKGVEVLAGAASRAGLARPIAVAGSGPLAQLVDGAPGLRALGALDLSGVHFHLQRTLALVLPSICYENFPRTIAEAFACGTPVIASRLGAMRELVSEGETGLLFEPGDPADLASKLRWAEANPAALSRMGDHARTHFEAHWSAEVNLVQLVGIYSEAIAREANRP